MFSKSQNGFSSDHVISCKTSFNQNCFVCAYCFGVNVLDNDVAGHGTKQMQGYVNVAWTEDELPNYHRPELILCLKNEMEVHL